MIPTLSSLIGDQNIFVCYELFKCGHGDEFEVCRFLSLYRLKEKAEIRAKIKWTRLHWVSFDQREFCSLCFLLFRWLESRNVRSSLSPISVIIIDLWTKKLTFQYFELKVKVLKLNSVFRDALEDWNNSFWVCYLFIQNEQYKTCIKSLILNS